MFQLTFRPVRHTRRFLIFTKAVKRSAPVTKNTQALRMSAFADSETISYEDHEDTTSPEVFN